MSHEAFMLGRNTHFTVAIHILTLLAIYDREVDALTPSAKIAESLDTNPSFLRQIIGRLREAGLVQTKLGPGGGSTLARDPAGITLLDVYRVFEGRTQLNTHPVNADSTCPVARQITPILGDLADRLDAALAPVLAQTTIHALADQILAR